MSGVYEYEATVIRWVDGDTVWLDVDLGFRIRTKNDFRLYGVDTPERGKPNYTEARVLAESVAPAGATVHLTVKGLDKYGRWLAVVDNGGKDVATALIQGGMAVPYFGGTR